MWVVAVWVVIFGMMGFIFFSGLPNCKSFGDYFLLAIAAITTPLILGLFALASYFFIFRHF